MSHLDESIPVFHVASMARSGETVLLRSLAAHPRLHVVHNVEQHDSKAAGKLFRHLTTFAGRRIARRHRLVRAVIAPEHAALVLKQGVWEHRHPFDGVVLVRNPVSVWASLRTYDRAEHGPDLDANWRFNVERLLRWLGDIDRELCAGFAARTPIDQFCTFYERRMLPLLRSGLPVVRYEDFVADPRRELLRITDAIGVGFDAAMLRAHEDFDPRAVGHGNIALGKAIDPASLDKYLAVVPEHEFDEIAARTRSTTDAAGYEMRFGAILVREADAVQGQRSDRRA